MKRFVAICLLVVCVALPLISWGAASYPCPKCGYHNTYTTIGISIINSIYTSHTHGVSIRTDMSFLSDIQNVIMIKQSTSSAKAVIL